MKRQIRRMVFETNSSSTHSLTMCSKEDYDKWQKGELLLNNSYKSKEKFITTGAALKELKNDNSIDFEDEDALEEALRDNEYITYDSYWDNGLEDFQSTFKTKTGEEIIAFGKYGYDD